MYYQSFDPLLNATLVHLPRDLPRAGDVAWVLQGAKFKRFPAHLGIEYLPSGKLSKITMENHYAFNG
jgi:hypothetical protein